MKPDERLDYYVTVAALLAEAQDQLAADAADAGSRTYAQDLNQLRMAVEAALEAAVNIASALAKQRTSGAAAGAANDEASPFH